MLLSLSNKGEVMHQQCAANIWLSTVASTTEANT